MKRRGVLAGVVVALTLGVSACGGSGGGDAAVSIKTLQAAASNTQAAESSRFVMDMTVDGVGDGLTMHVDGVMTGDGKTGAITMSMPMFGDFEMRVVDGTVYMKVGDMPFAPKLDGKEWVKLDPTTLPEGGMFGGLADQARSNGPKQGLDYLKGLSGDVSEVGEETVAGRPATHYHATIDYAKVADELPDAPDEVRDQLAKLGTAPADVWIDDNDHVVKMHFAMDAGGLGGGAGTVDMSMEITDFNVPVDVQAPPEDQVTDFSALTSQEA